MAIIKYLFPALAVVSTVTAQCSNSATLTIASSADASALASCTTYSGSIAINSGLAVPQDSNGHQQLSVSGPQKVTGNITVTNAIALSSLEFGNLQQAGGIELGGLTVLSTLSMPQLNSVTTLNFTALAALQTLSFGGVGLERADSILITNTGLSSLTGINNLRRVNTFNVNNNPALTNISLQVTSITDSLNIEANDGYVSGLATSFPLLETALNMTFRNCSSISLPALANVTQDLGIYGNIMKSFTAPNLTTLGGLVFVDNSQLTNISLPSLQTINATFQVANNTALKVVDGFSALTRVNGALDFSGNFTNFTFPALTQVQGAFNMQSSGSLDTSCNTFGTANTNQKIVRGHYVCQGSEAKPGTEGTTPSSTTSGSGAQKTNAAGRLNVNVPALAAALSVIGGLVHVLLQG